MAPKVPRRPQRPTDAGSAKGPEIRTVTARGHAAGSRAASASIPSVTAGSDIQGGRRPAALPSVLQLQAKRGSVR